MHTYSVFIAAATAGLVAALPQNINFAAIDTLEPPVALGAPAIGSDEIPSYSPDAAASSAAAEAMATPVSSSSKKSKRVAAPSSACSPLPTGFAPPSNPDNVRTFLANSAYSNIATSAVVPQGYQQVFQNLQGATEQNGYLGYYSLQSYDTVKCQEYCDAVPTCTAFNLYIERQPIKLPAKKCPNPHSTANYKCALYGLPISNTTATNVGQYMAQFHVVIAGSNGYVKNPPPAQQTNFTGPDALGGAISVPEGDTSYIGMRLYPGPYDPSQCAATCQATTTYDSEHLMRADGSYDACNFFNSYVLSKNNVPEGTYCAFYTQPAPASYGTNVGQYDSQGNYYSVSSSYSYTLSPQDPGVIASSED